MVEAVESQANDAKQQQNHGPRHNNRPRSENKPLADKISQMNVTTTTQQKGTKRPENEPLRNKSKNNQKRSPRSEQDNRVQNDSDAASPVQTKQTRNNKKRNENRQKRSQVKEEDKISSSENAARTEPQLTKHFNLKSSNCTVTLELIINSRQEPFIMIRVDYSDNRSSRIAVPFCHCDDVIDGLNEAQLYLAAKETSGVLNSLQEGDTSYEMINFKKFNNISSRYFIDFKCNEDRSDIYLKIKETSKNRRLYECTFDKNDTKILMRMIKEFKTQCDAHLDKSDLPIQKIHLFGNNNNKLTWIKTKSHTNLILRLQTNQNRVAWPINTCRSAYTSLEKLLEVYTECGDDMKLYLNQINADIDELNNARAEKGQAPLSNHEEHPSAKDDEHFEKQPDSVKRPVYNICYFINNTSSVNQRKYRYEIVKHKETGALKIRLIEIPTNYSKRDNGSSKREIQFQRHAIILDTSDLSPLIDAFKKCLEDQPLPPEGAYYYNGGRIFFKMNVRSQGLALKIKVQQALGPNDTENKGDEAENVLVDEDGNAVSSVNKMNYGKTSVFEMPAQAARHLIHWMKKEQVCDLASN